MAQALCENDHPLKSGESRCAQCGERIKMQWMGRGSVVEASRGSTTGSMRRQAEPPTPTQFAAVMAFNVLTAAFAVFSTWDEGPVWRVASIAFFATFHAAFVIRWRRDRNRRFD